METLQASLQLSIDQFTSQLVVAGQKVQQFAADVAAKLNTATASLASNTATAQANQQSTNQLAQAYLALATSIAAQTQAYVQAQQASLAYRQEQDRLRQAAREAAEEARKAAQAMTAWSQALSIAAGLGIATSISAIVSGLKNMAVESVQLAIKMQSLTASFTAITGSSAGAAQSLRFIRTVAVQTGTDFLTLAQSFKNFEAAARGTRLEGTKAQEVFQAISGAARVVGLSSAETGRAMLALEQMVSKGRVSMEELRRQLGNALPGAMQIAARAMGTTSEGLQELVRNGLDSIEFVTRFGNQVQREFGPRLTEAGKTAQATFGKLGNEVQAMAATVGASILTILTPVASFLEKTLRSVRETNAAAGMRAKVQVGGIPEGATEQESARLLDLGQKLDALKQKQESMSTGTFESWTKAYREQSDAIRSQIQARKELNVLLEKDIAPSPLPAMPFAADAKAIAKEVETMREELKAANIQFQVFPAMSQDKIQNAKDVVKILETSLSKLTEQIASTKDKAPGLIDDQKQLLATLNQEYAGALATLTKLENAKDAQIKGDREIESARKKAMRDEAALAQERLTITQDMTEQIAGFEESTFEKKKLQLAEYVAKARAASVDATLIGQYERDMLIKYSMEVTQAQTTEFGKRVAAATAGLKAESAQIDAERKALASLRTLSEADDPIERQRLAGFQRVNEARLALAKSTIVTSTQLEQDLANATTAINQKALDDRQKQQEHAAKEAQRPWRQLADDIQHTLSNAFENVLAGTFSLWDSIKQGFIRLLADLAASALTYQIIIPLAMKAVGGTGSLASAFLGTGGTASIGGGTEGDTGAYDGTGTASGTGGALGSALGMASSGASLYQGFTGQSLLGSNALIAAAMQTSIGSVLGFGGTTTASAFFGGGTGAAGAYGMGEAGMVGAATPVAGSTSAMGTLGATSIGTLASAAGVGIAAGQIFAKLNAMMGLHGTGNAVLSGAGGGAIAGTMILPGIGTAVGAAIGALGGYIASLFGKKNEPEPLYNPTAVQAGQVAYNPTQGLYMTATMGITRDIHRDVGGLEGWQKTVTLINTSLADMAQQVVGQFQGVAPELQAALVDPLNAAFVQIAQQIGGLEITGDTVEEFTTNLQEMMGTTLPGYFNDAMASVVVKLQETVKKIEPVFTAFDEVIATLRKDIDAIHGQQLDMHLTLQAARNALKTTLQSPAEAFMTAQGQYGRAKTAFEAGNAAEQITLAPALAQAAQQLLSMSKSEDVLGQDPGLIRNLQTSLLADLDQLTVKTDLAFDSMTTVLQQQVDAAEAQKKALISGLANPASLDQTIATSLEALSSIQNAIAASQGEGDPLVQAQVALLGGLTNIGTAQLTVLQDISSKLGGGVGSFAEGSQYVPQNMLAYIHAGERITPANNNYGGDTIHVSVNVNGGGSGDQTANQIANAVIAEIEKRGGRYGTTSIQVRR